MPLNLNLPTNIVENQDGHDEAHNATNAAVNQAGAVVDQLTVRTGALERGTFTPVTVPYAPSVILDATQGALFRLVATGNAALTAIINGAHGQTVTLRVYASGGDRTITVLGKTETITSGTWWSERLAYDQPTNTWSRSLSLTAAGVGAQPADPDLTGLAGLGDGVPVRSGGTWTTVPSTTLGPVSSVNGQTGAVTVTPSGIGAQPADTDLTALAGLGDGVPVRSGGTWTATDPASFGGGSGGAVDSVNGQTGVVVLTPDSFTDGSTNHVFTAADDTKLTGIAVGATANSTDAQLRDRATHTGTQAISTVTNLQPTLDGKVAAVTTGAKLWIGTQTAYDAIGSKDATTLYVITA